MADEEPKTKTTSTALFEPENDTYQSFAHDPRISRGSLPRQNPLLSSPLLAGLQERIQNSPDKQDFFDTLRLFKREQYKKIQRLESKPLSNRISILKKITEVAEAIIQSAYRYIKNEMERLYGYPTYLNSYKQTNISELAVLGMGKSASGEMNYESDLDLVFIFSHRGETLNKKSMSNMEYFYKFAQRFINTLSVLTPIGRCYEIDVELRPSGNAGTLVSSLEHFLDHQMNAAQEWERMALLRSRILAGPEDFAKLLQGHVDELNYRRVLPVNFLKIMNEIRDRILKEKLHEPANTINMKIGLGTLMDIDFILQGIELKNHILFPDLRKRSLEDLLQSLKNHDFLSSQELSTLENAYILYRTIESLLQITLRRAEPLVDTTSPLFSQIREKMGFETDKELQAKITGVKQEVRKIYEKVYSEKSR